MFLEAVSVCVNFSDILAHTLPLNKRHFDRMVIVRDSRDVATWNLCRHHHVECLTTDEFYVKEQAFNKGKPAGTTNWRGSNGRAIRANRRVRRFSGMRVITQN